jgi:glucose-6-phosphate 1-dehydrogenase
MRNIVLIFGITGDLSKRMLLPSLAYLCNNKKIPNIILYGVSRRDINPEDLFPSHPFIEFNGIKLNDSLLEYVDFLKKLDLKKEDQLYIYLSTPPSSALMYVEMLGQAGFNKDNVKLLLEKPFGTDYDSASSFLSVINK